MVLASLAEQGLRVQANAQRARRTLGSALGLNSLAGYEALLSSIESLETQYAAMIAQAVGAQPMAMGGLVTQPTFALIGEAGPEMVTPVKKKRKVSKYNRELGRQLKLLKKKHPRTKIPQLMKRAHRETRKKLKR